MCDNPFELPKDISRVECQLGRPFEMTKTVSLIHSQQTFQVLEKLLIQKCDLFGDDQRSRPRRTL
jgi:hypothetical protein